MHIHSRSYRFSDILQNTLIGNCPRTGMFSGLFFDDFDQISVEAVGILEKKTWLHGDLNPD